MQGLVIAAPASGHGKSTVTLGLARALRRLGHRVAPLKVGPDYIDPRFHARAAGQPCRTLDGWAMSRSRLDHIVTESKVSGDFCLVEGVMGLFDGAAGEGATGDGSTASIAARYGLPVILIVDASRQAQSIAALVQGFARFRDDVRVAGVIANRIGSPRHGRMIRRALEQSGISVLGLIPRTEDIAIASRHLGLVQAEEDSDLDGLIDRAADVVAETCDLEAILGISGPVVFDQGARRTIIPPPGQTVSVASDTAFAFSYPHLLEDWRNAGAEILPFSPLADEGPDDRADAVYLPGGYPELHAPLLSQGSRFLPGLRSAAARDAAIMGECGGYMVLGRALIDRDGVAHPMAGLLDHVTSFAQRRLSLGYRSARLIAPFGGMVAGTSLRGHEFHYATVADPGVDAPLLTLGDAEGTDLGASGGVRGRVAGSFFHLIDLADTPNHGK